MGDQKGVTLIELVTVVAVASMMLVSAIGYSLPWMAKQTMRSAVQDVRSLMQLAKIEAVSRNQDCRFVVDMAAGTLEVWDMAGNTDPTDDVLLHDRVIAETVSFERPDIGNVVTLQAVDTSIFQTVFQSDGSVSAGVGGVFFHSAGSFGRVDVQAAGGTATSYWNGSAWQLGS
jgi:prepilin-type N-terminal cleavage/methylation domain-containing protein